MFWDGERWMPDAGHPVTLARPVRRPRLRRWFAVVPLAILLVPGLVMPVAPAEAATYHPRVVVRGTAYPGGLITIVGTGFRAGGYVQARWDSSTTRLRLIHVNSRGGFRVSVQIPRAAKVGTHRVRIGRVTYSGLSAASVRSTKVLAQRAILSVTVKVRRKPIRVAPLPTPTPSPTPSSTPDPGQAPAPPIPPDPTPTPAPTPTRRSLLIPLRRRSTDANGDSHADSGAHAHADSHADAGADAHADAGPDAQRRRRSPRRRPRRCPRPRPRRRPPGIPVPASVDATGGSDASAALIAFIGSVPDGSTIVFRAGATYRLDAAIKFAHRRNLTLAGNGATLRGHGGTTEASSLFWLGSYGGANSGIVIRDFSLVGNSTTPGVYQGGKEGAHAILVDGGSGIDLSRVTVSGVWGDCLYVGGSADGVTFHDATCRSNGRNGVTITSGSNVTVQRVAFDAAGYCTFDIEPNQASEAARSIRFLDNTAGTWSNSFLSAEGAAGSVVSGVTVSGNTVTGRSLLTVIGLARRQNVVFTNNRSSVAASGPVLRFAHVDGLTVSGNVQPLSSGSLASISDSTGVTYTP